MPRDRCGACAHFRNDPDYLEAVFGGLASLSSAYASVRGEDGVCLLHERYLGADAWCRDFVGALEADQLKPTVPPPPR
jgi:hypothetical protein